MGHRDVAHETRHARPCVLPGSASVSRVLMLEDRYSVHSDCHTDSDASQEYIVLYLRY